MKYTTSPSANHTAKRTHVSQFKPKIRIRQKMMAQIANIAGYIREARDEKKRKRETEDKLLDTAQAAKMLNVSKRTMQRMRTDHRIEYVVVRGSCRYRLSEILRLLEDNTVRNEEGTIDTLFHNHTLRTGGKPKGRRT